MRMKEKELEIWGKAQRESTRRRKFDWGSVKGAHIPFVGKSRGPDSNALAYAERGVDLG